MVDALLPCPREELPGLVPRRRPQFRPCGACHDIHSEFMPEELSDWRSRCDGVGQELVLGTAIVRQGLVCHSSGALLAVPTTSLTAI